jgi:Predicted N-acetylglucosamine kinase
MSFIVGIDSGGTHIVGQVIELNGNIQKNYETGSGNILIDEQKTKLRLNRMIETIFNEYSLKGCVGIVIGIAGLDTFGEISEFKKELTTKFNIPVILMSDATLALWNILSGNEGILSLSGTGSAVFSRFGEKVDRIGGWGYLVGDEGSAYDIARRSLQTLTSSYDQGKNKRFIDDYLKEVGQKDLFSLISKIYSSNRKEIAELSMTTNKLSSQSHIAKEIISAAAISLANQTILMMQRHTNISKIIIGESGSVLQKNNFYKSIFEKTILDIYPETKFITTSRNNASGSIYWYQQHKEDFKI